MNKTRKRNNGKNTELVGNIFLVALCMTLFMTVVVLMKVQSINSKSDCILVTADMKKVYAQPDPITAEVKTLEKTIPVIAYTQDDVELLANIMYYEVGGFCDDPEGEEVVKLAGSVVINRVLSPVFPNTVYDVIYQPGQYAKSVKKQIGTKPIPEKIYTWAEELLTYGSIAPDNLLYQSQFKQGKVYKKYKGEYFCLSN